MGVVSKTRRGGGRSLLLLLLLLSAAGRGAVRAQTIEYDETQIRAAMLLNLPKFIFWPAAKMGDPQKPFVICYVGEDAIGDALNSLLPGKQTQGRSFVAQSISNSAQISQCHILYVPEAGRKIFKKMEAELSGNAVLTISDRQLGDGGIMIGLPRVKNSIQIQIDLKMAQSCSLTISSKLLHLAAVTR